MIIHLFVVGSLVVYSSAVVPLDLVFGGHVGMFVVLPVALAGWLLGMPGGFFFGLLAFPLHTLLLNLLGQTGWDVIIRKDGTLLHAAMPILGGTVGLLRNSHVQLRKELSARRHVEEALKATNNRLRSEASEHRRLGSALGESEGRSR